VPWQPQQQLIPEQQLQLTNTMSTLTVSDDDEVIDYTNVPEAARGFYKQLPELYPNWDAAAVRQLFVEHHCDQDYFFQAIEDSQRLLDKSSEINTTPFVTPVRKEVKQATVSVFEEPVKTVPIDPIQALELKKAVEEKFVVPKYKDTKVGK
jgi:hypothetical protein